MAYCGFAAGTAWRRLEIVSKPYRIVDDQARKPVGVWRGTAVTFSPATYRHQIDTQGTGCVSAIME